MTRAGVARAALAALLLALTGCASGEPRPNPALEQARVELAQAAQDPAVRQFATAELTAAQDALVRAEQSWLDRSDEAAVTHRAYVARQRAAIAREAANLRRANERVNTAETERQRLRSAARAQAEAQRAQAEAEAQRVQAEAARERAARVALEDASGESARRLSLAGLPTKQTSRGTVVVIEDDLFATNSAALDQRAEPLLDRLARALQDAPDRAARVEGYSDSSGDRARDVELSGRRAAAIRAGLIARGVPAPRLRALARGDADPVASNGTAEGRARNRRVEVVIAPADQSAGATE